MKLSSTRFFIFFISLTLFCISPFGFSQDYTNTRTQKLERKLQENEKKLAKLQHRLETMTKEKGGYLFTDWKEFSAATLGIASSTMAVKKYLAFKSLKEQGSVELSEITDEEVLKSLFRKERNLKRRLDTVYKNSGQPISRMPLEDRETLDFQLESWRNKFDMEAKLSRATLEDETNEVRRIFEKEYLKKNETDYVPGVDRSADKALAKKEQAVLRKFKKQFENAEKRGSDVAAALEIVEENNFVKHKEELFNSKVEEFVRKKDPKAFSRFRNWAIFGAAGLATYFAVKYYNATHPQYVELTEEEKEALIEKVQMLREENQALQAELQSR